MTHSRAILNLVIAALLWSSGGILIKLVDAHPLAIAGIRSAIGVFVIGLWTRQIRIRFTAPAIVGGLCYAGTVTLFVIATKMTTAANAILLQYTAPIYVALLGPWLLKEHSSSVDWLTIIIMATGMLLFFFEEVNTTHLLGNVVGALSGVCFAGFIFSMRMQASAQPIHSVILGNAFCLLLTVPYLAKITFTLPTISGLIALGVLQLAVPYILYSIAIRHVSAVESSLILTIEPILNPIWVLIGIGEIPSALSLTGGVLVVSALAGRSLVGLRAKS